MVKHKSKIFSKTTYRLFGIALLVIGAGIILQVHNDTPVMAAPAIVVNSTADTTADDGECTLREAIIAANTDTASGSATGECIAGDGADFIFFDITGAADFTSSGQDGYTIKPNSGLPEITEPVTINGYSQSGAQPNTTTAPQPLNGVLLIEIDGVNTTDMDGIKLGADDIAIRGLVINNFDRDGIDVDGENNIISGNYIGTEPDAMTAAPNDLGIGNGATSSDHLLIGGLNPYDRNVISGNTEGGSSPNTGHTHWTYQGNYVGVGKDGLTAVPNAQPGGSGALSIDNDDGHVVGGSQTGAINVISGNNSMGIAPHNADDLLVEGNYLGVGYDGTTPVPNQSTGINLSDLDNATVRNNIISFNNNSGINFNNVTDSVAIDNTVEGNSASGINIMGDTSNIVIGSPGHGNTIFDNRVNMSIASLAAFTGAVSDVVVQSNTIGYIDGSSGVGINVYGDITSVLIGGTGDGEGNTIVGNEFIGVSVATFTASAFAVSATPNDVAILGNSIYNTAAGHSLMPGFASGLGIDLVEQIDTSNPPDAAPDTFTNLGPTLNDPADSDTGANSYINFPVLNNASQTGDNLSVDFSLDAAGSTNGQYRVEFFANDTADASGYGEGQTYLGSATVTNGDNQMATIALPANTNLTGKTLSATTTSVNNATNSGFGSTSEFSAVLADVDVNLGGSQETTNNTSKQHQLANTGNGQAQVITLAVILLVAPSLFALHRLKLQA